jgi:hypothetical protein
MFVIISSLLFVKYHLSQAQKNHWMIGNHPNLTYAKIQTTKQNNNCHTVKVVASLLIVVLFESALSHFLTTLKGLVLGISRKKLYLIILCING